MTHDDTPEETLASSVKEELDKLWSKGYSQACLDIEDILLKVFETNERIFIPHLIKIIKGLST